MWPLLQILLVKRCNLVLTGLCGWTMETLVTYLWLGIFWWVIMLPILELLVLRKLFTSLPGGHGLIPGETVSLQPCGSRREMTTGEPSVVQGWWQHPGCRITYHHPRVETATNHHSSSRRSSSSGINKHALPVTITKSGEVQFSIWFLLTFRRGFARVTQLWRSESDQKKMKNKKKRTE